jgi:hypothetical protein
MMDTIGLEAAVKAVEVMRGRAERAEAEVERLRDVLYTADIHISHSRFGSAATLIRRTLGEE